MESKRGRAWSVCNGQNSRLTKGYGSGCVVTVQTRIYNPKNTEALNGGTAGLNGRHCRPSQDTLLWMEFWLVSWLDVKMSILKYEHLIQQMTDYSRIPFNSTAFPKLNIQNVNE